MQDSLTPEQEISKEFMLKSLDKIDHYWNFLVVGLVAFIGWLVTTEAQFTPLLCVTAMAGYVCFAGMNLAALWTSYLAAEALSADFADSISKLKLPGLKALAKSHFNLKRHRLVACMIHALLGCLILIAIGRKATESGNPSRATKATSTISTNNSVTGSP